MSLTAAVSGFVVVLLSVSVIQGQNDWEVTYSSTEICALKGSTVNITCSYRYPSTTTRLENQVWLTKASDLRLHPSYSGRVQYNCVNNLCTLRITDLRESDSAEYKFSFTTDQPGGSFTGSPGVTLSVTEQPKVTLRRIYSSSYLYCLNSCKGSPSYSWFKNGQKIHEGSWSYHVTDFGAHRYSCAVNGYQMLHSPPVYPPGVASVSVHPPAEIREGGSVTLTCFSDAKQAAKYSWYKSKGDCYVKPVREEPQLVLSSIQSSDSGQYYCTAENELQWWTSDYISVNVKYAPKSMSVSVSSSAEIVEGSSVTLTCSSDANPAATYTWYKEDQTLLSEEPQLVFSSVQSSDIGKYHCIAENKLGRRTSNYTTIDVKYAPKLPSVSVSSSAEIVEGSSVTLTCSSDANPAATYTWYKKNQTLLSEEPQLVFSSVQSSDSGDYYCTAENQLGRRTSNYTTIDVKWNSTVTVNIIRLTVVVLMLIPLPLLTLWMRKKKTLLHSTTDAQEPAEMIELDSCPVFEDVSAFPAPQTEDTEQQEDSV